MSAKLMVRPRIKEIFGVLLLARRIRLDAGEGCVSEIDDPEGRYRRLVVLLDGSRTIGHLKDELRDVLTPPEVDNALHELDESGYLEDAVEPHYPDMSRDELEGYLDNLDFFDILGPMGEAKYWHQRSLKQLRVGLIGMGDIGSNVAIALAQLGVGVVRAVDFDEVQLSDPNGQGSYSTSVVDEAKAGVSRLRTGFDPDTDFAASARRIRWAEDVADFIDDAAPHIVCCVADNLDGCINRWVNNACVDRGIIMIAGSVAAGIGYAYSVTPGRSGCYNCLVAAKRAPKFFQELGCIRSGDFNAANGAAGMFHAYFLVYEILRSTLGIAAPLTFNRLFEINFATFEQHFTEFRKLGHCKVCGAASAAADDCS
ncbi:MULTISPECIES: ThiF family adenylyltransferase [unclassified Nocardia]|uniref:HesA/MoeB/ThiF family protein n=1 Tax=unclassified Nocardia TaxID=2637762 RepID=UPI001CE3D44F|nr:MULTISPECIES: ThiF family adenylyltransferase [unclassified Nocardia]